MGVVAKVIDYFTDAKGRGEVKVVLGFSCIVIAFVRLFQDKGVEEFLAFMGAGLLLLGITALADHAMDKKE